MFGVLKESHGSKKVHRLIMNLTPANKLFRPFSSDIDTLPMLSQMIALDLEDDQQLLVSSEDIKCMFYLISLPKEWRGFFGFNRVLPKHMNPPNDARDHVLAAKVLPMGFLNSVGISQHIHRNIVGAAVRRSALFGDHEIRKDRAFPVHADLYRVYLDNFDYLRKVAPEQAAVLEGDSCELVELLRDEYSKISMPRNEGKTVREHGFWASWDGLMRNQTSRVSMCKRLGL